MSRRALLIVSALVMLGMPAQAQQPPRPTLTAIAPTQTTAGVTSIQILVSGTGFLSDGRSEVRWDRVPLPTSYVPGAQPQLVAQVGASLLQTPGTVSIDVINYGQLESLNQLPFTINPPPAVSAVGPPRATINQPYSHQFTVSGGTGTMFEWHFSGSLPPGLALNSVGLLTGTPTTAGTYTFQIWVVDSQFVSSERVTFVAVVGAPELTITTTDPLPSGAVGTAYSQSLVAQGGVPPYSNWRLVQSALPAGLSLEGSMIAGTPQEAGTTRFQIAVSDSTGSSAFKFFSLTVNPAQLSITTASPLPAAAVGVSYSQLFTASGGTPPYVSWSLVSGGLPLGLSFTFGPNGPLVSGTPTQSGSFSFTVAVTDSSGARATKPFSLTVSPAAPVITTGSLPSATVGLTYSQTFQATGGATPYNWTVSAGLPPGLSFSAIGLLSGAPTAAGTYTFTVTVNGVTSKQFTLTVAAVPAVAVTGPSSSVNPLEQPSVDVQLDRPYALTITGTLELSFAPNAVVPPPSNPQVQFSSGGQLLAFTIPAGQTQAAWAGSHQIQTGTVAGTITVRLRDLNASGQNILPTPAPTWSVQVVRAAPKIVSVQIANRTSTGFNLLITGYSTPRQVTQAVFSFTGSAGGNLQTTQLTVALDSVFTTWYGGASSTQFGSSFLYTQPFTVSGNMAAIASVSVTLVNSTGSSTPMGATF